MREIVLDTETTGLDPEAGHRIVEVACLELMYCVPTGRHFRKYVNPERDMPADAQSVHGLTAEFLARHPPFGQIVEEFLAFIDDAPLVIHNAQFDLRFLNAELARVGRPPLDPARAVDTVALARQRFPGAQVSLDALCRRFEIDTSARTLHGALLDCQLLADVYLELRGGRQPGFDLGQVRGAGGQAQPAERRPVRPPRPHAPTQEEIGAHEALLGKIKDPIWRR
ncbi:MAG: DNA polymerase III subunit epsilon [Kiloniellaceae bacterium]